MRNMKNIYHHIDQVESKNSNSSPSFLLHDYLFLSYQAYYCVLGDKSVDTREVSGWMAIHYEQ